jgi:hypothetical protein
MTLEGLLGLYCYFQAFPLQHAFEGWKIAGGAKGKERSFLFSL